MARLDKEGPQGNRKNYVRKIKSLQHQLDEDRMGNDDLFDDEDDLPDILHDYFEGDGLDTTDNKNLVPQGGPRKINKTKKLKMRRPTMNMS